MENYIVYYDSGTTNTRVYLLNESLELIDTKKYPVGSKDSAISGSNKILIEKLYELLLEILLANDIEYKQISEIYASGMITSKFGLKEIPHLIAPASLDDFSKGIEKVFESTFFKKDIHLIPGVKTDGKSIEFINMMRGEEMETIGVFPIIPENLLEEKIIVIIPGSHTQIILIDNNRILDINSNFTGELYHAISESTILSPVAIKDSNYLDKESLILGLNNLKAFGFTRALYITQIMQTFNYKNKDSISSYLQGIINGGAIQSLENNCQKYWKNCNSVMIIGNNHIQNVFKTLLENSNFIENIILPNNDISFALKGFVYLYRNLKQI